MRFAAYYAFHSFINQIRKMLKTWVIVFIIACGLIGGLIGFGAGTLVNIADEREAGYEWYEDGEYGEEGDYDDIFFPEEAETEDPDREPYEGYFEDEETRAARRMETFELIYGAMILAAVLFSIFIAEKGKGSRFLPADVSLLFASPLRPQTVLFFRLLMQIGLMLYMTVYMMINFASIARDMGLDLFTRVSVMIGWFMAMFFGKLLETYIYLASAENSSFKKYADGLLYALVLVPAAAWFGFWKHTGGEPLDAAKAFFNAPLSRAVPIWGWIKGIGMYASEGNIPLYLLCLAATVGSAALFMRHVWHMKADFYEDAMARSEELAQAMLEIEERKSTFGRIGKKKIKEDIERDGMNRGAGASVFFWKAVLNRKRFSRFMLVTKTSVFYLIVALGVSLFTRNVVQSDSSAPAALALGAVVFFRALGNPLEEDTKIGYTAFIPEYAWKKLAFSALGGVFSCFMDLVPGLIAAAIINPGDIKLLLLSVPLILTVDLYAGSCGSFIALSTPDNAGTTVKQLVQIMFIYFGLLPDIAVIAVAGVFDRMLLGIFAAALINLLLSFVFISLSGNLLDPRRSKRVYTGENCPGDPAEAKSVFDRIGRALFIMLAVSAFLQYLTFGMLPDGFGADHPWLVWVVQMAPLYLIAIPLGLLVIKRLPSLEPVPTEKMSLGRWMTLVPTGFFLMYSGNIVGLLLSAVLTHFIGGGVPVSADDINPLTDLFSQTQFLPRTLVVVIMAPVIEELLFRKVLIGRTRMYGDKTAVVFSALCFGLFHANLPQFCYASLLGLLLGAVYIKSGKLIHTIGLHMCVNFMGGVVAPFVMQRFMEDSEGGAQTVLITAFFSLIVLLFFLGAAIFIQYAGRLRFAPAVSQLYPAAARRCAWLNAGSAMFVLFAVAMIALSLVI